MFGLPEALMSFIRRQVGLRTDAASATGSLHAKVAHAIARSNIKSIQRGTIVLSATETTKDATISAVTPEKTQLTFLGASSSNADATQSTERYAVTGHHFVRLALTNSTTITATRATHNGREVTVSYEAIEYF